MKHFLKKTLLSVILLFVLLHFGILLLLSIYPQYFLNGDSKDYYINNFNKNYTNERSNFTNLIIGDSRGLAGIKPKLLGEKWLNLCLPGSNFLEGYYTLKKISNKNKIDTLILNYGIDYIEGNSYFFNRRTIPFNNISISNLKNLEKLEDTLTPGFLYGNEKKYENSFLLRFEKFKRKLKYNHSPLLYRETIIDGISNLIKRSQKDDSTINLKMKKNNGQIDFEQTYKNTSIGILTKDRTFNQNIINRLYLDSLLAFSNKNKIVVIMTISPINKSTYLFLNNSTYWTTSLKYLETIKIKYPSLIVFKNPEFMNNDMFSDDRHLNKFGAISYTQILKKEINNLKKFKND